MNILTPRQVADALRDEAESYRNRPIRVLLERAAELIEEQIPEPQEGDMIPILEASLREKEEVNA